MFLYIPYESKLMNQILFLVILIILTLGSHLSFTLQSCTVQYLMTNYHLRITYHPLQNPQTFISSELNIVLSQLDCCSSLLNLLPAKATAPLISLSIPQYVLLTALDHSTITSYQ